LETGTLPLSYCPSGSDSKSTCAWDDAPLIVVPYVLFFLAGLVFGYAAPGTSKWLPLLLPLALALLAAIDEGIDGTFIVRLVIALGLTVVGVLLGALLDRRDAVRRPRSA
jgi:4-amino-4-deoxy-L-arabinose transferase-like glycosyltransferase